jgi:entericidin A
VALSGPNSFPSQQYHAVSFTERTRLPIIELKAEANLRRYSMRKLVGLALVAGALMVSACNTVEGVGKDVSSAGSTVAKTADDAK